MRIIRNVFSRATYGFAALLLLTVLTACGGEKKPALSKNSASPKTAIKEKQTVLSDTAAKQEARHLMVYYFMTSYRCRSCLFIENTTRKALDEQFANELKSGRIVFKLVNIEEPQNKHFVDEYGIYTKTVILSDMQDGKQAAWKNLDQVWSLIGQDAEFKAYIAKEVKTYLGS